MSDAARVSSHASTPAAKPLLRGVLHQIAFFASLVVGTLLIAGVAVVLLAIGVALTTSPVVYKALEGAEFFKVGLTIVFLAIAIVAGIKASAWGELRHNATNFGTLPTGSVFSVPRGTEHKPSSPAGARILMLEPSGTLSTGDRHDEIPDHVRSTTGQRYQG